MLTCWFPLHVTIEMKSSRITSLQTFLCFFFCLAAFLTEKKIDKTMPRLNVSKLPKYIFFSIRKYSYHLVDSYFTYACFF